MSDPAQQTTEPCPLCGEADHAGPCATLDDWWLSLSPTEQERIIAEGLANG